MTLMCWSTAYFFQLKQLDFYFYIFVFASTFLVYNLHYFSKSTSEISFQIRFHEFANPKKYLLLAICIAALLAMLSALPFATHFLQHLTQGNLQFLLFCFFIVLFPLLYTYPVLKRVGLQPLKKYGLLKPFVLAFAWTLCTIQFPIIADKSSLEIHWPMLDQKTSYLFFATRFLWVLMLCFLFDVRDKKTDAEKGIRTWPNWMRVHQLKMVLRFFLLVYALLIFWLLGFQFALLYWLLPVAILMTCIETIEKEHSIYFYLFVVDGLMLLEALAFFM
jgi:4-hydroxybenzoate polyprenyltransferase